MASALQHYCLGLGSWNIAFPILGISFFIVLRIKVFRILEYALDRKPWSLGKVSGLGLDGDGFPASGQHVTRWG